MKTKVYGNMVEESRCRRKRRRAEEEDVQGNESTESYLYQWQGTGFTSSPPSNNLREINVMITIIIFVIVTFCT